MTSNVSLATVVYLVCTPPWLFFVPSNWLCEKVTRCPALFDIALCTRCTWFCREFSSTPLCNLFIHSSWGSTKIDISIRQSVYLDQSKELLCPEILCADNNRSWENQFFFFFSLRILAMLEAQKWPLFYISSDISTNIQSFKNLKTNFLTKGP